jgi:copper transport protein
MSGRGAPAWTVACRWLLASASLALAMLLLCVPAQAHATLTGTIPADGEVLAQPPPDMTLSFNEPVSLIAATLVMPGGTTLTLDRFSASGGLVSVDLPEDLSTGSHALSWRAVSEDGHPISGTTFFIIGAATENTVADQPGQDRTIAGLLWLGRLVLFVGIFFGAGGAAFRLLAELPPGGVRFARWSSLAGLVAVPVIFGLQGVDLLGSGLSGLWQVQAWGLALTSPYATTLGLAAIALGLGVVSFTLTSSMASKVAAGIAILLVGLAVSASGHASAAEPRWLTRSALFLHATTIAWWVGALLPLILLLRQSPGISTGPLLGFSRAIPFAIVPLVVSGAVLAVIQLGPLGASWWSPYGQVLAAKLILLVVLFSIASWNRWVLTVPAAAGDSRAIRHMRRGIAAEIVIIIAVLGLVSSWRFTPPPRAYAVERPAPLSLRLADDNLIVTLSLSSGKVGTSDAQVTVKAADGEELAPRSVTLALEPQNGSIAPIVRRAEVAPDGSWRLAGLNIPLGGLWRVEVQVRISDFELAKLSGDVEIAP